MKAIALLVGFGVSVLVMPFLGWAGRALRLVDAPDGPLKFHRRPVPLVGGAAVVAGTLAGVILAGNRLPATVVAAVLVALGAGLLDDFTPRPAGLRLILLIVAGVIVAAGDAPATLAGLPVGVGIVFLVVATSNAVNMVDGKDALAGGVAAIATGALALIASRPGHVGWGVAPELALAGALAGFVVWNRPPARVFLGNGGAYAVGVLLAAFSVQAIHSRGVHGFLAAGVALGVFAFEIVFTVARRMLAGKDVTVGDRDHAHDLLARRFGHPFAATLIWWGLGAVGAVLAVLIVRLPGLPAAVIATVVGATAVVTCVRLTSATVRQTQRVRALPRPGSNVGPTDPWRDVRSMTVTGGAGFIGSNLVRALVSLDGFRVRVFDDLSTGAARKLGDLNGRVELVQGDVRDAESVASAVAGSDIVFHLAALPSVARSVANPRLVHEVNATGTLTVLTAARDAGVRRFVYASSSSVYGDTPTLPKHERMPVTTLSPYAASKFAGESYCRAFTRVYGLETIALRFFNVFGPGQDPASEYAAVIPRLISRMLGGDRPEIFGDGRQSRDFTYVANIVDACIRSAVAEPDAVGEVMNVGCGERITLVDLVECLNDVLGTDLAPVFLEPRPGDVRHSQADISKAVRLLGYTPSVSLREGLTETAEWFGARTTSEPIGSAGALAGVARWR